MMMRPHAQNTLGICLRSSSGGGLLCQEAVEETGKDIGILRRARGLQQVDNSNTQTQRTLGTLVGEMGTVAVAVLVALGTRGSLGSVSADTAGLKLE